MHVICSSSGKPLLSGQQMECSPVRVWCFLQTPQGSEGLLPEAWRRKGWSAVPVRAFPARLKSRSGGGSSNRRNLQVAVMLKVS